MFRKGVQLPFPQNPVASDPEGSVFHGSPHETAPAHPTVLLSGEKPRAFEDAEMLRDGGKRNVEGFGQRRHRRLAAGQAGEDGPAGRVRQGRKSRVKGVSLILNHMVNYISPGPRPVKHEVRRREGGLEVSTFSREVLRQVQAQVRPRGPLHSRPTQYMGRRLRFMTASIRIPMGLIE